MRIRARKGGSARWSERGRKSKQCVRREFESSKRRLLKNRSLVPGSLQAHTIKEGKGTPDCLSAAKKKKSVSPIKKK